MSKLKVLLLSIFFICFNLTIIAQDCWQTINSVMPTPRNELTAQIVDDHIYAIGGYNPNLNPEWISTVEIFNTQTQTWHTGSDMPTARSHVISVLLNGKIWCIGGLNWTLGGVLNHVEVYNPLTNLWETKAPLITVGNRIMSIATRTGITSPYSMSFSLNFSVSVKVYPFFFITLGRVNKFNP